MADHRVTRTAKEEVISGARHRHISALCLDDGGRVTKSVAMIQIQAGFERYWTAADGQRAWVEVVARCGRCGERYLRTDRDATTRDNLLSLPDCT